MTGTAWVAQPSATTGRLGALLVGLRGLWGRWRRLASRLKLVEAVLGATGGPLEKP